MLSYKSISENILPPSLGLKCEVQEQAWLYRQVAKEGKTQGQRVKEPDPSQWEKTDKTSLSRGALVCHHWG
jgi:hypothetical protein